MNKFYTKNLAEISQQDSAQVGGKNASLGEMLQHLAAQGIRIPAGFAITAQAYQYFIEHNTLHDLIFAELANISDYANIIHVDAVATAIRTHIEQARWPADLAQEILDAYKELSRTCKKKELSVAVRSSAMAEDLPDASSAGQQESFLHMQGEVALLQAIKKCFASLFTARAITYRHEKNLTHVELALSICVQQMVYADRATAGVMFTLDTESGFPHVIAISASYGLGESVVQGNVNPDEYLMYKNKLGKETFAVLQKRLGSKTTKIVRVPRQSTKVLPVAKKLQKRFALTNEQLQELAHCALIIEQYYQQPMDIEWAYDSFDKQLYIVQARPETIHRKQRALTETHYTLHNTAQKKPLLNGLSVGKKIVTGRACVIRNIADAHRLQQGDILVTHNTDPDWVAVMKRAAGIITDIGGRTCHAAIVSRELGVAAVVGTHNATGCIKDGDLLTLDCSQGSQAFIYAGAIAFTTKAITVADIPVLPCKVMLNLADPESALAASQLPVDGVGLARLEFVMTQGIGIHPLSATQMESITDKKIIKKIEERARGYETPRAFFVETLTQGVSMLAAAFYPRPVIVRLSDFKSNEYRDLLGGEFFEPQEENPMLGWRGASRYCTPSYEAAFALECTALKKVRDAGFSNMKLMVPFVRTVAEAENVCALLKRYGLERGKDGLELYMMVEIPSNVLLLEKFAPYFDGFSIGSNDLTQLTLGVDRDSGLLAPLFDERDEAVTIFLRMAIEKAHRAHKPIGVCGQAPSDYPEIAQFLIDQQIDSLSLNKDAVIPFVMSYSARNKGLKDLLTPQLHKTVVL